MKSEDKDKDLKSEDKDKDLKSEDKDKDFPRGQQHCFRTTFVANLNRNRTRRPTCYQYQGCQYCSIAIIAISIAILSSITKSIATCCMFGIAFGIAILLEVKYCNTQKQYFFNK